MQLGDALRASIGELWLNKLRTGLTLLGVIIGVGAIVLLASLGEGLRTFLIDKISAFGTNLIFVQPGKVETGGVGVPPGSGSDEPLTWEDAAYLRERLVGVDGVSGLMMAAGDASFGQRQRDCLVMGVDADYAGVLDFEIGSGRFFDHADITNYRRACVIGWTVRQELFPGENPLGRMLRVDEGRFRVVGVLVPKGNVLGHNVDDLVYLPVSTATRFYDRERLTEIDIKVQQGLSVDRKVEEIKRLLITRHDGEEDFTVLTFASFLEIFDGILAAVQAVLVLLASIALVVGGIGIMNIMLVSVRERTREIGIRKAIGATRRDIMTQFLIESVVISLLGGAIGALGASAILLSIPLVYPEFPSLVSPFSLVLGLGFSTLVGIFFGVYPALKAARLPVVDALRFE